MGQYYDGIKLLNKRDLDGERPEIYICTGNRTAGKSYFFKRYLVQNYIANNEKFMVLFRKADEMTESCSAFFEDIRHDVAFKDMLQFDYTEKSEMRGAYKVWYLNGEEIAFATYLNAAEKIKRGSSRFIDVKWMLFDEMQSETYSYVENEVDKFISIHISVARGHGEQSRYVPCILIGNSTSLINPYFLALKISDRYTPEAKFIRGTGWVAEFTHNESAENAIKNSAFNRAFSHSQYINYASQNKFLLDNTNFVEKCSLTNSVFVWHFIYEGFHIGCWFLNDLDTFYFSKKYDPSEKAVALTPDDHTKDTLYMMITVDRLKQFYDRGRIRFETLEISEIVVNHLLRI